MIQITSIKFSKIKTGYRVTAVAKHDTEPIVADYTIWGTSTRPEALRSVRDSAKSGAIEVVRSLAGEES